MLLLKCLGLLILIVMKLFLLMLFCYFILLGGGYDEILDLNFVMDLKMFFELLEIV